MLEALSPAFCVGLAVVSVGLGVLAAAVRGTYRLAILALLAAGFAAGGVVLVTAAETPFGIGDGVVPDLRGQNWCTATKRLERRGLRWRFDNRPAIHRSAPEDSCVMNPKVTRQMPAPGNDLGEGSVVVLFLERCDGCL
jgi:hypothetical protein